MTLAGWREVMAFDVESIVLVTQTALPNLLASRGSVINVASVAGLGDGRIRYPRGGCARRASRRVPGCGG